MKTHNISFLILGSFLIINVSASAQKGSSGIYKTTEDFQNRKLSYAIDYKTEKHKINNYVLFNDAVIKVKHHDTTYTLQKSETYGYRNMKGEDFRFIDNKEYKILNPGEPLLIYVYQHPSHSPKEAEKYLPMYYFSIDASAVPQPLTKTNLKKAFPDSHKFHHALDAQFKSDDELYAYDNFHNMYKLNRVLKNNQ